MIIHWFELKQLDRVTNYSTEIEPIKLANRLGIKFYYYCTYANKKRNFGLKKNIRYLGISRNKIIKYVSFRISVIIKSLKLALENNNRIIVNQDLILDVLPSLFLSKILNTNNKFIIDIRTTPTNPHTFENDMKKFHQKFKYAVKYFDGFSFITPFMKKTLLKKYQLNNKLNSVLWSSGVNMKIFNFKKFISLTKSDLFKVFYHGGISESRGNLILIKACELLVKKGFNLELIQVGICVDDSIKNYICDNNLESWCKLLDPVNLDEIPELIANSDLPVLPFPDFLAWRVSSPIKLMEYLSMGKKVLAPNIEAFTDIFENNQDLIFYYDVNKGNQMIEIANQIESIIKNDYVSRFDQNKAVNFVSENFTWEIQAKRLINFCNQI